MLCSINCKLPIEQLWGGKHNPPSPNTPHNCFWYHIVKIHKKDNSIRKKGPKNLVTMYVVLHRNNGKRIWCKSTGNSGMSNSDKAVQSTEPLLDWL